MNVAVLWLLTPLLLPGQAVVAPAAVQAQATAAAEESDEAVLAGRDALDHWWPQSYPWYDGETDGVRRIEIAEPWDWSWLSDWATGAWEWFKGLWPEWLGGWFADFWSTLGSWLRTMWDWLVRWPATPLGWIARIVLVSLATLLVFLALRWAARRWWGSEADSDAFDRTDDQPDDADRIESLPVPVQRGRLDLLGEAQRLYARGDYCQAIIYLFSFQLVRLDRQQVIRLAKGKTNRQYLREVGPRRALGRLLEQTMVAFEDVFFGNQALDRARFEACWTRLDEFESLAAEGAG